MQRVDLAWTYVAFRANEAAHILNDAYNRNINFLAEIDFFSHIQQRNFLFTYNELDLRYMNLYLAVLTCGVVTITAPSMCAVFRYCTMERCSSEVPGGVSMTR